MTNQTDSELLEEYKMLCHLRAAAGDIPRAPPMSHCTSLDEAVDRGAEVIDNPRDPPFDKYVEWMKRSILHIMRKHYET